MTQPAEVLRPAPREIADKDTGLTVAYACRSCGSLSIFGPDDTDEDKERRRDEAAAHCSKQCVCGRALESRYHLRCPTCRAEKDLRREQLAFEHARKIAIDDYPDNPVYCEGAQGDMNGGGYFSSIDALLDHFEENGKDLPQYVWACTRRDFRLDAHELITRYLEEQEIDPDAIALPHSEYDALQKVLDEWIARQGTSLHAWFQDTRLAVLLRDEKA